MTDPRGGKTADIQAPALREDLVLHPLTEADGDAVHLVYDPVAHRYHELDGHAISILSHWRAGTPFGRMAEELSGLLGEDVTPDELFQLAMSFDQAGLFSESLRGWRAIHQARQDKRQGPFAWLLHNYLFVRVPLVRPDSFLQHTLPVARFFASWPVLAAMSALGIVGLYLTSRQWDTFTDTLLSSLSLEGAAGYLAALAFAKVIHELGHAYTARHFGCRIPTMGLAFLVLAPVLYTDVTDAWRLQSRRQRILITAGGMLAELALAAIALFLWSLLPNGALKSACFFVATTSLVMSLTINLSPLMRFDGYYILADYWGISNLQPRAFALMRWWLREMLFGLKAPCPEDWPRDRRFAVILYGLAVCVYRLFLFIGIALLVYHMTFKILGILLFVVEILWFVARPIWNELKEWWRIRPQILSQRRYRMSLAAALAVIAIGFVPWPHRVEIPAVLEPVSVQRLVAPVAAQVKRIAITIDQKISPGDILIELDSPKLRTDIAATRTKLDLAHIRRNRRIADQDDRNATITLDQEIGSLRERLAGLQRLEEELTIRAGEAGIAKDLPPGLRVELWVGRGEELGLVVNPSRHQVRGYLPEEMVATVKSGARGVFVPDEPLSASTSVRLESVGVGAVSTVDLLSLSSVHGGTVAVTEDKDKAGIPIEAQYQVVLATEGDAPLSSSPPMLRGIVRLDAKPDSFVRRTFRRAIAILVRESGF